MEFRLLLAGLGLQPEQVALCLHKPSAPQERAALARMAENAPDLFDAYQRTHPRQAEATLKSRQVMASFLTRGDGSLVFLGLWRQDGWVERSAADLDSDPMMRSMLVHIGAARFEQGFTTKSPEGRADFTLTPLPKLAEVRGRLIVADPGARAYMRRAETTPLPVLQITAQADLSPPMPDWRDLVIDTPTLRALPERWRQTLRHWRGIYLITDSKDGARYVGAAYGEDNLLGRWQSHMSGEAGITVHLSQRDPARFVFSILELLSPVADPEVVSRTEQQWMRRLHTRQFGLNS